MLFTWKVKHRVRELLRLNVHYVDENGTNRTDSRIVLVSHQMQTVIHHHLMLQVNQKLDLMKTLTMKSYEFHCNLNLLKLMDLRRTLYIIFLKTSFLSISNFDN